MVCLPYQYDLWKNSTRKLPPHLLDDNDVLRHNEIVVMLEELAHANIRENTDTNITTD